MKFLVRSFYLACAVIFVPALSVSGEVPGISLIFREGTELANQSLGSGQMVVGRDLVGVFPDSTANQPSFFQFDGRLEHTLRVPTVAAAAFAGNHLYLTERTEGLKAFDTKTWKEVQSLRDPRLATASCLVATPDGAWIFVLNRFAPAGLRVFRRDASTGMLSRAHVFQGDDASLALARATSFANPGALTIEIEKDAERIANFDTAESMAISPDGDHLYVGCYTNSLLVFGKRHGEWELVDSVADNVLGHHTMGLMMSKSVAATPDGVFVGGIKRLSWFRFDGKRLTNKQWWVDDSEYTGHNQPELPFLDNVTSLATSPNGKYLFVASAHSPSIHVLKIGEERLSPIGTVSSSRPDGKMLEVKTSPDGTRLFAKTTATQLEIYELDDSFTSQE